jgi:hypothetical protein
MQNAEKESRRAKQLRCEYGYSRPGDANCYTLCQAGRHVSLANKCFHLEPASLEQQKAEPVASQPAVDRVEYPFAQPENRKRTRDLKYKPISTVANNNFSAKNEAMMRSSKKG